MLQLLMISELFIKLEDAAAENDYIVVDIQPKATIVSPEKKAEHAQNEDNIAAKLKKRRGPTSTTTPKPWIVTRLFHRQSRSLLPAQARK